MKKVLTIIMSAALVVVLLAGCGSKSASGKGFKDGTYKADAGKFDDHGWKPAIEVTVKDGKIANVVYDEFNKDDNHKKSEDAKYKEAYSKQVSGADQKVTYEKLTKGLVEKQDVDKVDAVAGATSSTKSFKELAKKALDQAK